MYDSIKVEEEHEEKMGDEDRLLLERSWIVSLLVLR